MASTIGICIQARMNSTRLPGKVLMDFQGKPMLLFQIDLLRQFELCSNIVVLTSNNPLDDQVEEVCISNGIDVMRGSEENVFSRFQKAAAMFPFDHIIRLTADNPIANYRILQKCISQHLADLPDLTSTRRILSDHTVQRFAPKGNSVDIISAQALLDIESVSLDDFEKEHVIPVFFRRDYEVSIVKFDLDLNVSYSIDTMEELERVRELAHRSIAANTFYSNLCHWEGA